jgi:opacity protein-like surface antigen
MRRISGIVIVGLCALGLPLSAAAQEHKSALEGFGGLTFGTTASSTTFGGSISAGLTDNLRVIGEVGRIGDLKPSLVDTVFDLTPFDMRLSAWYGEAGVRFVAGSHGAVRPYAEATAGLARLSAGVPGLDGTAGALIDTSLKLFNRTEPLLGVGGGVLVEGGPLLVDIGYRYKKIMMGHSLQSLMTLGNDVSVSQARVGVGVRF